MPVPNDRSNVQNSGNNFEPLPNGMYNVEVVDITLEQDVVGFEGKVSDKFYIRMGILDESQRGKLVMHFVSTAWTAGWDKGSPSKLWEFACAITRQTLNDEDKFDVNSLIGQRLQVIMKKKLDKKGKTWSNVVEVMEIEKAGEKLVGLTDTEKLALMPKEGKETTQEPMSDSDLNDIASEIHPADLDDLQPELNEHTGEPKKKKVK